MILRLIKLKQVYIHFSSLPPPSPFSLLLSTNPVDFFPSFLSPYLPDLLKCASILTRLSIIFDNVRKNKNFYTKFVLLFPSFPLSLPLSLFFNYYFPLFFFSSLDGPLYLAFPSPSPRAHPPFSYPLFSVLSPFPPPFFTPLPPLSPFTPPFFFPSPFPLWTDFSLFPLVPNQRNVNAG